MSQVGALLCVPRESEHCRVLLGQCSDCLLPSKVGEVRYGGNALGRLGTCSMSLGQRGTGFLLDINTRCISVPTCFLCYRGSCLTRVLFLRAIVFVVDSVAFQREVKDVAEFLYQVLVDSTVLKNAPALLIACNKQGTGCCPEGGSGDLVLQ